MEIITMANCELCNVDLPNNVVMRLSLLARGVHVTFATSGQCDEKAGEALGQCPAGWDMGFLTKSCSLGRGGHTHDRVTI